MGLIYKVTNEVTGQIYVGKTKRTLNERWASHVAKHRRSRQYLHRSMRVYGLKSFNIEIIEECGDDVIDDREKHWIKELDSMAPKNFNMKDGGEGGDTSKSENYIIGMKNRKSMAGSNNPMYGLGGMKGKNHTDETKILQSLMRQQYWDNLSENQRKKRSDIISGDKNPMYGKRPTNNPGIRVEYDQVIYESLAHASKSTGISTYFIKKNGKIL